MEKLKSRKLWVTIVSAVLMVANQGLGLKLPTDSILSFAGVVMSYIFGQSIVDAKQQASLAPKKTEVSQVINDQQEVKVPLIVKDDDNEAGVAPSPVAPVQPIVDPNAEKLKQIADLQQQINELQVQLVPTSDQSIPKVVIG